MAARRYTEKGEGFTLVAFMRGKYGDATYRITVDGSSDTLRDLAVAITRARCAMSEGEMR